ncbi:hypothetical protein [Altericista sp. CCNU0014]|uniref:hypothetical protein n=1 Tax=Altericista sp. CCNU0014 TaxID=3082949 RepID=UPI00384F8442
MTSQDRNDRQQELENREKALQDRELAVRLKELEAKIHERDRSQEVSDSPTRPHAVAEKPLQNRFKKFVKWSKVIGFSVLGLTIALTGMFVGIWLVFVALLGGAGFICYKLLWESDRSKRP